MLNVVLNVLGIIIVLYALILIKRDKKNKVENFMDQDDFEANKFLQEINNFSDILGKETEKLDKDILVDEDLTAYYKPSNEQNVLKYDNKRLNSKTIEEVGYGGIIKDGKTNKQKITSGNDKILELKNSGLTIEEIAKKTGRSVREIEVVLKMYI